MPDYPTPDGATPEDIARVLTAHDPKGEADAQIEALERLEDWVEDEKRKWRHAQELAQLLSPSPEVETEQRGEPTVMEPSTVMESSKVMESTNGTEPDEGHQLTRREAITRVLEDKPGRSQKLSEIVAELERRGWSRHSQYEDHMVLRTLSTMLKAGTVKRPRKGYYKLVEPRKPDVEPATTEAGDDQEGIGRSLL
jgi:hypothetical protein